MDFYECLVPRLSGEDIEKDFHRYADLVKKGVAGFIVFGGEIETLRACVQRLQSMVRHPLVIASDLEQGLGQQVRGGTLFPPAMALGKAAAGSPELVKAAFARIAEEAAYTGINTVLAPVLDINTNPDNPIISTRAFGEDPETVSTLGAEMVRTIQGAGIAACAKHFPGHGDTSLDSHLSLPTVNKSLKELESLELSPFRAAIKAGVRMIMPGHLSVPALDPTGEPVTFSSPSLTYLRKTMGFNGIIVTDAMDMGAIKEHPEPEASALRAGVDLLLHPEDAEKSARKLEQGGVYPSLRRIHGFRKTLLPAPAETGPAFDSILTEEITRRSIETSGPISRLSRPFVVVLSDDKNEKGAEFSDSLGAGRLFVPPGSKPVLEKIPPGADVIIAVFSSPKAWKGGTAPWIRENLLELAEGAALLVSFGSPYVLEEAAYSRVTRIYAFWGSTTAQRAAAELILS